MAEEWAKSKGMLFLEASAKTKEGISQVFQEVVQKVRMLHWWLVRFPAFCVTFLIHIRTTYHVACLFLLCPIFSAIYYIRFSRIPRCCRTRALRSQDPAASALPPTLLPKVLAVKKEVDLPHVQSYCSARYIGTRYAAGLRIRGVVVAKCTYWRESFMYSAPIRLICKS